MMQKDPNYSNQLVPRGPQGIELPAYIGAPQMPPEFEPEAPPVPITHYLWILRRQLWKIAAFVAVCVLATFIISTRLKPIFESTATIDIDRLAPTGVVGQPSAAEQDIGSDSFISTQIRLIQSDSVLRPVAEQFHLLNAESKPNGESPAKPQSMPEAPVSLGHLRVNRPTGTNLVLISYRSTDPRLSADIANAIANSYLSLTYNIQIRSSTSVASFMEKQLDELKAKMEKSSLALNEFEKDLDVINPEEKTNIISARLLQLNGEYTSAQAQRVSKEAAFNTIKSGSLEAAEVSSQSASLAKLSDALAQAKQHFVMIKATYGSSHPEYRKAATELAEVQHQYDDMRATITERIGAEYREALNREQMLQKAVAEAKADWDHVNSRSFQYNQLKREADADKALYDELIRKIRESDINAGFQNNNIRIADPARPAMHPVYPDIKMNLFTAFAASLILAIACVILLDTIDTTLRDPQEASRFLKADVIGTMPVDRTAALLARSNPASSNAAMTVTAEPVRTKNGYYRTTSDFEEAIRSIRNTILLSDFEGRLRSIVLTSAAPSEGKSTIAAHLAIANADRGKKTLLVDADLRRPSLHAKFGIALREGLSNVLTGELLWQNVVVPIEGRPNLSLLPSGPGSHRAADLVGPRLSSLLDEFAKEYDLVILDSPPLLGFAECLQMATAADGVLIISKAGETRRKAVAEVISVLQRLRANIIGVVLNQMNRNTSSDGYAYYGYQGYNRYQYRQSEKAEG